MAHPPFDLLVFDLGGVLVDMTGIDRLLAWMSTTLTPEAMWRTWLLSPAVRAFESGAIPPAQFAAEVIVELALPVSPEAFLTDFAGWPKGLYPGTLKLLQHLAQSHRLASLSNTNSMHWPRFYHELHLATAFDYHFPSHETGRLKPDREAFQHVIEQTGCAPERILFLDDNQLNVDSAVATGIVTRKTVGIGEVHEVLRGFGLL